MRNSKYRTHLVLVSGVFLVCGIVALFVCKILFGAPDVRGEVSRFVVLRDRPKSEVLQALQTAGLIKYIWAFNLIHRAEILPGAYKLSSDMGAFEISRIFKGEAYMKWVTIPEGLRKEEIADILATELGWTVEEKQKWISVDTEMEVDYSEGVFFPDTYLIPLEESTSDVAERLRAKFEEVFALYAVDAASQNIKWTTVVKLASILEREASGSSDMPLVAGILWNRLLSDMRLEVDATLQYAKGRAEKGWWVDIVSADKQIDSPFNTYRYAGLPPHPISNPGRDAIRAVLFPEETDCIFYLHDNNGEIHCSTTYSEHLDNIEIYLK